MRDRSDGTAFVRALAIPLGLPSLLFVILSSLLLAFFQGKGVLGVFGSYFLIVWLFKYAYVLLEHVANGEREAPVVSVEMLGPFEQRPLIQATIFFLIQLGLRHFAGASMTLAAVVLLCLLPASSAVLGIGAGVLQSLNPLMLWRVMRGLGHYYFAILVVMITAALLMAALIRSATWNALSIATAEIALLIVFSALGGALYERRLELGFEPRRSPERDTERADAERKQLFDAMLDELYTLVRTRRGVQAQLLVQRWLADANDRHVGSEAHAIVLRTAGWAPAKTVAQVVDVVIAGMTQRGRIDLARELQTLARARLRRL